MVGLEVIVILVSIFIFHFFFVLQWKYSTFTIWKEVIFFKKKENVKFFKPAWSHSIKNDSISISEPSCRISPWPHSFPTLEDT